MKKFSLATLSDTQFEEFCYDLLAAMGATRVSWRKGTGMNTSPADQGRDIECFFEREDFDGHPTIERWFVDCKHYERGIPPEKLQSLLAWSSAERPDVALIIASEFLSNPAKNYLENYRRENRPHFKIKVWERPDLEKFSVGKPLLMRKYGLAGEFEFLNILHPAHVHYIKHPPLNSLKYFFKILDELESGDRDRFFFMSRLSVIKPTEEQPRDLRRQVLGDLIVGKTDYLTFRDKCSFLARCVSPHFLVRAIIIEELSIKLPGADLTNVQEQREKMRGVVRSLQEELTKPKRDYVTIQECIDQMNRSIPKIEERTRANYDEYCSFCEKVVMPLFDEPPPPMTEAARKYLEDFEGHGTED
jgi:hypothetical protein